VSDEEEFSLRGVKRFAIIQEEDFWGFGKRVSCVKTGGPI